MIVKSALKAMSTAIMRGLAYYRMRSTTTLPNGATVVQHKMWG